MEPFTLLTRYLAGLSPIAIYICSPAIFVLLVVSITRLSTEVSYYYTSSLHRNNYSTKEKPQEPPQIPYNIPFLDHAISFLSTHPIHFFDYISRSHPRDTGGYTLLLGGRKTYVLTSPKAVQALFKARGPHRDKFNADIFEKGLAVSSSDTVKFYSDKAAQEKLNDNFLLRSDRVNELTFEFSRGLQQVLDEASDTIEQMGEMGLYTWLRDRMFKASTDALMGERLLESYPGLCNDFFEFEREFLSFFFGFPKWTMPDAYQRRDMMIKKLKDCHQKMHEESGGLPMSPDNEVPWEPVYGSRLNRGRHIFYNTCGISADAKAGIDLGLLFGISSNAIPATGWMLFHILNPHSEPHLLDRVMAELGTIRQKDRGLDVHQLVALPLLSSIFHEVLRLYVDALVTRFIPTDLALPVDEDNKQYLLLKKDTMVLAPSWIAHHDPAWMTTTMAPENVFYAERFLRVDPETGKHIFSASTANGRLLPFGGGKTICPGRVFAKQEVLAAVAMVLLGFEFDILGYLDGQGNATSRFPGIRKSYPGTGTVCMDGDLRVRVRKRVS
ncbi:cytochrome P450 [Delphinella strobiligena]|nr:cytochrome P450 [Delphinella strobiligena]